jgi:hypothetical protein
MLFLAALAVAHADLVKQANVDAKFKALEEISSRIRALSFIKDEVVAMHLISTEQENENLRALQASRKFVKFEYFGSDSTCSSSPIISSSNRVGLCFDQIRKQGDIREEISSTQLVKNRVDSSKDELKTVTFPGFGCIVSPKFNTRKLTL